MSGPPRAIEGSTGSRVRLIFGDTGSEWLLLLNEDDGNSQWQTHNWKSIPNAVANQLNNCSNKGRYAKEVDFGPNGEWYINGEKWDGTCGHSWWGRCPDASDKIKEWTSQPHRVQVYFGANNDFGVSNYLIIQGKNGYAVSGNMDDDLFKRVKRINRKKKSTHFARLFGNGGYFISDDEGTEWKSVGVHCGNELKGNGKVEEVAVAGDGTWVVMHPSHFVASNGVDKELKRDLDRFYREQNARRNRRAQEIRAYIDRIAREAREATERAIREAAEAVERERLEREAAEQAERESAEREASERQEREAAEQLAREEAERQAASSSREAALETLLEERFLEEVKGIKQQEAHLRDQETRLRNQKRSLQDSIEQILPPNKRARLEKSLAEIAPKSTSSLCIVCHDHDAVRAVVPCGHHCLCDGCADTLSASALEMRLCPLCRGKLQSTLKIFTSN